MTTRRFSTRSLEADLRVAQAELEARGAGEGETWVLPPGRHRIEAPLVLGAEGRILTLRGANSTLVVAGPGLNSALTLRGVQVTATGVTVEAADGFAAGLDVEVGLTARLSDVTIRGVDGGDAPTVGMRLRGPSARLVRVNVTRIAGTEATGIDLSGVAEAALEGCGISEISGGLVFGIRAMDAGSVRLDGVSIGRLSGDEVTGFAANLSTLESRDLSAAGLRATGGPSLGVAVMAVARAEIVGLRVAGLTGIGEPGRPFEDLDGDGAGALRLTAPAGRVAAVRVSDLHAPQGRAVALRIPETVETADLSVGRALAADDLAASVASAQAELADHPVGADVDWTLPAGVFRLADGLTLGVPDRSLTLRGAAESDGGTELRFEDGGAALPGDVAGLTLVGRDVTVSDIALRVRATGAATGYLVESGGSVTMSDLRLTDLRGTSVTGLRCHGAARAQVFDCEASGCEASDGDATAFDLDADQVVLADVTVSGLTATMATLGISVAADAQAHLSVLRLGTIEGDQATGIQAHASGAEATLAALDVRATDVSAMALNGLAVGIALISGGDVEARALAAETIVGGRALGTVISAMASADWLAGEVRDIQSRTGGAAGARIIAAPSPARDDGAPSIAVRDLRCEAVRGPGVSGQAAPPQSWLSAAPGLASALAQSGDLTLLPAPGSPGHAEEVVGLAVHAPVSDFAPWVGGRDPGSVAVENCVFRRISGTVLQLDCGLRDVSVRGSEAWTGVAGGWLDAERILLANLTWHRMSEGIDVTGSDAEMWNSLVTQVTAGPGVRAGAGGEISGGASFVADGTAPLSPEPAPPPYRQPGPATPVPPSVLAGALAPSAAVDLALPAESPLHDLAETVPGDDPELPVHMGALPPDASARCILHDPAPPPLPAPRPAPEPSPFVDYLNRDSRGFLTLMESRAAVVMPDWTTATPADFTTMLMEMLASELDFVSYRQEEAVANGYLGTATLRRALEDHARLVDHHPDPGQSATAMLRFSIGAEGAAALGLEARFAAGGTLTIPRDTLVVNPDFEDVSLIFATEEDLVLDPRMTGLALHPDEDLEPGALSALLEGDVGALVAGRWLSIHEADPDAPPTPAHVVRVVSVEEGTDRTRVFWDPRRPAPTLYRAATTRIEGNIVPAHHGVPLTPLDPSELAFGAEPEDPLAAWREMLNLTMGPAGAALLTEVPLPVEPVSILTSGWPFPDAAPRIGRPEISASLDGMALRLVDDLADDGDASPRMALRSMRSGGPGLVIDGAGDGGELAVAVRVGLGAIGNVGAQALTRVLAFGRGAEIDALLPDRADRLDIIHTAIEVSNDNPAVGGRDPDSLETLRADAPLSRRRALSAVAPRDYESLLVGLDEVASARARSVDVGLRRVIRVTALLRNEDELTRPDLGDAREAERLRIWALARRRLEQVRLMGFDLELTPPDFVPLDVDMSVDLQDWANADRVRRRVEDALKGSGGLFDPDVSGLGGDVSTDAIKRCVLGVEGVRAVRLLRLRRLAPAAIDYARAPQMPIGDTEVAVLTPPYGGPEGVLTVETCGGLR